MNIKEKINSLVSTPEEFNTLYNVDYLYIVIGQYPDDNKLTNIDVTHHKWRNKLRGPHSGPFKVANTNNNSNWFHGYIYAVTEDNFIEFEKSVVVASLLTGYTFEKISVSKEKEHVKNKVFDKLFSEVA